MNLYQAIIEHFNEGELKTLCFNLGIDFDALPGDGKAAKARELIAFVIRRDRQPELIEALKRERPQLDWENLPFPPKSLHDQFYQVDKRLILAGLVGVLLIGVVAWLLLKPQSSWTPGKPIDEAMFGIAIAEFTVGADQERSEQGRETSQLLYQQLENLLNQQIGLTGRVTLTKVGVVRDSEEAKKAGEKVNADVVLWGWIPVFNTEAIVPNFTILAEDTVENSSPLLESVNLMISGPGTIRLTQLSGRTLALSRFVIAYVYLRSESTSDYGKALDMFELGIQELEQDLEFVQNLTGETDDLEQRLSFQDTIAVIEKTLAIFYTGKGVAFAALSEPDEAYRCYETALSYDENYSRVYMALGNHYHSEKSYDDALVMFSKAETLEPTNPGGKYGLGITYFAIGEYDKSVAYLNEALPLIGVERERLYVYLVLGYAYQSNGAIDEAIEAFRAALDSPYANDEIRNAAALALENLE